VAVVDGRRSWSEAPPEAWINQELATHELCVLIANASGVRREAACEALFAMRRLVWAPLPSWLRTPIP
jgi:hypothetical protein